MISYLKIANYRCLGPDTRIRLGKLTVLVGPNGAGKSTVADVIRFLADILKIGLESALSARGGIGALRTWGYGRPRNVAVEVRVSSKEGAGLWSFEIAGDNREDYRVKRERACFRRLFGPGVELELVDGTVGKASEGLRPDPGPLGLALPAVAGDRRLAPLVAQLRSNAVYSIAPNTLARPQNPDAVRPMQEEGDNWCSVLRELARDKKTAKQDLLACLGRVTGEIDDCRVRSVGSLLAAEFRHGAVRQPGGKQRQKWFEAAYESAGTLRVAGVLTALLQDSSPPLTGVEEPELTVHPGVLPLLAEYLKEAATRCQLLVTTHSPDLLEHFSADDVRIVERNVAGLATISRMHDSQRSAVRKRLFTLGELMRIQGLRPGTPDSDDEPSDEVQIE